MAHSAKGKSINIPCIVNLASGKESICQTGFSDQCWGKATCSYARSAQSLPIVKFDALVQNAQKFMKLICSHTKTTDMEVIEIDDNDDDEHVHLVDNSDDSECMSSLS